MIRVALGEPNEAYARALMSLIRDEPGLAPAGRAKDVPTLVTLIDQEGAAVAVVSTKLPGGGIGAVAEQLHQVGITCRLVAIASVVTAAAQRDATEAGSQLVGRAEGGEILEAIMAAER